jgi:putative membrane protein
MVDIIAKLLILSISIFAIAQILPGVKLKNPSTAILVGVVYSVVNMTLGWVLKVMAFPFIFVTLGLFTLLINAFLLWVTDKILEDFEIDSIKTTFIAAVGITIASTILGWIF